MANRTGDGAVMCDDKAQSMTMGECALDRAEKVTGVRTRALA